MLNASLNFVDQGLTFQADGPGMSIDPATGQVTISSDVLLSGIEVTVTDGNSAGSTVSRFRVTVAKQKDPVVKPALLVAPTLSGTGVIGASVSVDPGQWSGQPEPTLALQWRAGEVAIPGATAAAFEPTPAEDGADLDCLVTATNAGGSEALAAGPLRVTQAPPVALGTIADVVLTQGGAPGRVEAAGLFSGAGLSFSVAGAGAEVDASGVISVPTGALLAEEVVVTASNSGGSAEISFHVTVAKQKDPVVKPALLVAPTLSGTGVIGASVSVDPGQWSGQPEPTLALQWRAGEVAIPGATAAAFEPTPAEDGADLDCLVTATNAGGSEALAAGPLRVTQAPPVALGTSADVVLTQGGAPGRVEAAGLFSGAGLSFSVAGAGAEVDASGVISVPTGALLAEEVVVTASNSGGSATAVFRVSVVALDGFPADLDVSLFEYSEIRDAGQGAAVGARKWVFGTLPNHAGFKLHRISTTSATSLTPSNLCESGQTYPQAASYAIGSVVYGRLMWYRESDGARQLACAVGGTSAGAAADADTRRYQRVLTAVSGSPTRGEIAMTILGYEAGEPVGTAPAFTSAPSISGSTTVGSTLTATPATVTGSPAPTITHRWYRDGVQQVAVTGLTYVTSTPDLSTTITYRSFATNIQGTALSPVSGGIAVMQPSGTVFNVNSLAAAQTALNSCTGGETVRLAPGNYDGTITLSNKTYSSTVTLTSQNLANPAVFTGSGITWTNVRRFHITGLHFKDTRTDADRSEGGQPVASTAAIGMRLYRPRDGRVSDCLFDRHHIAIDLRGSIDCTFDHITIERMGMDGVRLYSHFTDGGHLRLRFSEFLVHNTLIHLASQHDSARHPDAFQAAVNWSTANGHQEPPDTVTWENCWIECLQAGCNMHGVLCGNSAARSPGAPNNVPGGGYPLATAGYQNLTFRNLYIETCNEHGVAFEGVNGALVERVWMKRGSDSTLNKNTPQLLFLPMDGVNPKFANITVRHVTGQRVPSPTQANVPGGIITVTNYTQSTNPPAGFTTLVKAGATKNVGSRV